jgi:hypothetical protein
MFCLFCFAAIVSEGMCEEIADMRRKIQRVSKKRIIFMDEVAVKLNEGENYTFVLWGWPKLWSHYCT